MYYKKTISFITVYTQKKMKTSLYPKRNHLYATLKQMKHVNIIFNRKYSFIAYLMFDFQKNGV